MAAVAQILDRPVRDRADVMADTVTRYLAGQISDADAVRIFAAFEGRTKAVDRVLGLDAQRRADDAARKLWVGIDRDGDRVFVLGCSLDFARANGTAIVREATPAETAAYWREIDEFAEGLRADGTME